MFEKMKLFLEIVKEGSISQAAANLYTSQSAVSTQLKILETQVGFPLFDRVGRNIRLNQNGTLFLRFAQETLQNYEAMLQEVQQQTEEESKNLTISAGSYFNVYFLPKILPLFSQRCQQVEVHIITKSSDIILHEIEQKNYEFGIVGTSHPIRKHTLVTDFCYSAPLYFVCSPASSLAQKGSLSSEDLERETFIFTRQGSNYRQYLEHKLSKLKFNFAAYITNDSMEAIRAAVSNNLGVTILPQYVVQKDIEAKKLIHIPLKGVKLTRMFCCIHHAERPLSNIQKLFIEMCKQVLNEEKELR